MTCDKCGLDCYDLHTIVHSVL